jgi:hypothetical protein
MKGAYLLCLVLFVVLAIPLFADHTLVNPVGEFSAISTMNTEEVPLTDLELIDSNVPVLAVGLTKEHPANYIVIINGGSVSYTTSNNTSQSVKHKNTMYGGVKRTNLRKH